MAAMQFKSDNFFTGLLLFSNGYRLASVWLVIIALLVTKPLLSSTNPIVDEFRKGPLPHSSSFNSNFDLLFEDIKALVVAAVNNETNVAASMTTSTEELVKISRKRRSASEGDFPFGAPKSCSLTKDELKRINYLLGSNEVSSKTSCRNKEEKSAIANTDVPADCKRMIGYFIRKVRDIKNEFRCLNTPLVLSDYRYEEQKAAYETKVRQLGLQLKSAEKKFDQKFKKEIDKVMKRYHELEKNMRETLEQLQKERLANVDDSTKLIVQYLVNGKIHSAWDVFNNKTKGIGNDNITGMLNRIIGKAFTDNVPIKNVIRFTGGLKDNVDAMVYGAIRVFNELEYRLIFDPITVDLMYATIEDLIKTCIDLEGTDSEESQLTVHEHMLDKLIVINNKIEFLKYTYGQ